MQLGARGKIMTRESIAIVGPGRMGIGITTSVLMADHGHKVTFIDTKMRESGKEKDRSCRNKRELRFL